MEPPLIPRQLLFGSPGGEQVSCLVPHAGQPESDQIVQAMPQRGIPVLAGQAGIPGLVGS